MLTILQKIFMFFFGHAAIDGAKEVILDSGKKVIKNIENELTRKDLVMGVIIARLGTVTRLPTPQETTDGINKHNEFYASLSRVKRDLFEQLFYRDALDAIQEYLKSDVGQVTPDMEFLHLKNFDQADLLQMYLGIVGLSGPKEIRLEMERLYQMSTMTKVKKIFAGKGKDANRLLNAFLNGLEGK